MIQQHLSRLGNTKHLQRGDGDIRWFFANLATVKLAGEETGGEFCLVEIVGARGDMPPLHVHHMDDETFLLVDGEATLFVGGDVVQARSGSVVFAPRGVPHTYRIESETATWQVISTPAFAEFVLAASVPAESARLPTAPPAGDPAKVTELASAHGIEILGPPGALPAAA